MCPSSDRLTLSLSTAVDSCLSWCAECVNKILVKGMQSLVLLQDQAFLHRKATHFPGAILN